MNSSQADPHFRDEVQHFEQPLTGGDYSRGLSILIRKLLSRIPVRRGVLAVSEPDGRGLTVVATWREESETRNLLLRLPKSSSLFEKVVEDGGIFSESFCGFFSGSSFERRLLLDDDSKAYLLQPLKRDGRVIGVCGFSSDEADAFATVDEAFLVEATQSLTARISEVIYSPRSDMI